MRNNQYFSDFYCTQCGNKTLPIVRQKGRDREGGHLKKLYCVYCQRENNCAEIRPFGRYQLQDFITEFEGHNFASDGTRKTPYKQFLQQVKETNN